MIKLKRVSMFICKHTLCKLNLHLVATVIETRPRYKGKHIGGHLNYTTSRFTHYVKGYYEQCICCGKKFSNFERI